MQSSSTLNVWIHLGGMTQSVLGARLLSARGGGRMLFRHSDCLPFFCSYIGIQMCEPLHTWQAVTLLMRLKAERGVPQGVGG